MGERVVPQPNLNLEAAAAKLGDLAALATPGNLRDPKRGKVHFGERRQRLEQVRGRLGGLYEFFATTEGVRPSSADAAQERYETMLDLLVYPLFDPAMTEIAASLNLPEGTAISLIGSGGNGAAQVRTLAAADVTFDPLPYKEEKALHIGPDVDMTLISGDPVSLSVREAYRDQAKTILTSRGLKPCRNFNLLSSAYSTQELWEYLVERDTKELALHTDILPSTYKNIISAIFYPLYPKQKGNQMRKEMLERLAQLRESKTDKAKYEAARARIITYMRDGYNLTDKHFGFEERYLSLKKSDFDTEGVKQVRSYFADRMIAVFSDMLDMAEPPKVGKE